MHDPTIQHEERSNGQEVDVRTRWFGLRIFGTEAAAIFVFLSVVLLTGFTLWEHQSRKGEHLELAADHERLGCLIKLDIYMHTRQPGAEIIWNNMPVDLYSCVPKFLYEGRRQQ